MSNLFEDGPTPLRPGEDIFGPRPEELERLLSAVELRFGKDSAEVAAALVRLGDAHMVQGRLSNPHAQASYERALQIFCNQQAAAPQIAWVYDRLANVKDSSGDTIVAALDLARAIEIWETIDAESRCVAKTYVARRTEDLARLQRVNQFNARRPPDIE